MLAAMPHQLKFATPVRVSPIEAWKWISSFEGISKEMAPYLRMSAPKGVNDLSPAKIELGKPMFRSWIKLFGVIPFDYSDLTLLRIDDGVGFLEQSPMGSMRLWRHERRIEPNEHGCVIHDELTFEPRIADWISFRIVRAFFTHRHRNLARYLG